MENTEYYRIVSLIANLGALTVLGLLYAAYIKNLKSALELKSEQIETQDRHIAMWRDKALDLERRTPEYVEKLLSERINVREDELRRLGEDAENNKSTIEDKNTQLATLREELKATHSVSRSITVYDKKQNELRTANHSELELIDLGEIWVDTATIFIGDPYHFVITREHELEERPIPTDVIWFRDNINGDVGFEPNLETTFWDEVQECTVTLRQLAAEERVELIDAPTSYPVDPSTYIKGEGFTRTGGPDKFKSATFYNGTNGAGIAIGLIADGNYSVRAEKYDGRIVRIMIDV